MSIYADGTERIEWGTCSICGVPIMHEGEWDARHSVDDDDMHEECCNEFGPCSEVAPTGGWSKDQLKELWRGDSISPWRPWWMPSEIISWAVPS